MNTLYRNPLQPSLRELRKKFSLYIKMQPTVNDQYLSFKNIQIQQFDGLYSQIYEQLNGQLDHRITLQVK